MQCGRYGTVVVDSSFVVLTTITAETSRKMCVRRKCEINVVIN